MASPGTPPPQLPLQPTLLVRPATEQAGVPHALLVLMPGAALGPDDYGPLVAALQVRF